jgi:hypothetical protein
MAVAAALLAIRFMVGPFRSALATVNSPVNAGAAAAVAFVLLALIAAGNRAAAIALPGPGKVGLTVLVIATAVAFWPNLQSPFVYDDYGHIAEASHTTWQILADAFRRFPGGHGLFFRPVGFISYWLDYQWAGGHAVRWHLWSIAAHAANACLVYFLVTRLGIRRAAALVAALLFALHGSRAETVSWPDARFDLLATLFALCALLAVLEYCRTGRRRWYVPLMVCAALAVYTKESAFSRRAWRWARFARFCLPTAGGRWAESADMTTARASARSGTRGRCIRWRRYCSGNGPSCFFR